MFVSAGVVAYEYSDEDRSGYCEPAELAGVATAGGARAKSRVDQIRSIKPFRVVKIRWCTA